MRKKIILFLSLFIFNMCFISLSWAGIRIDKPKIRISVESGSYDGGEIKVESTGNETLPVKVYLEDWVYSQQDGGKEFMPKATTPLSCSNWITFYPADFTLSSNGVQIVRYTVNVPKDARGGYYSVMFFETGGGEAKSLNEKGENINVKILNRLGALFYVEPKGTIQKTAEIKNIELLPKLNNLAVTADFFNTGNTDITVKGTLDILDSQGFVYGRGVFDDAYTLAKEKAVLRSTIQSAKLKAGDYDLVITLEFDNGGSLTKETEFHFTSDGAITALKVKD